MHCVVRVERNAVQRFAIGVFVGFDFNAVRIVRADFVQSNDVRDYQAKQNQRYSNHVKGEKAV